ncbi:AAA family ATPase [Nannocystis radixulma]|uniref:AAA family ATPase n=1 Tax=Nannocystis radixulma TaxID=2995305 RepID=A0ABT5BST7_9BACT|nr:AAA family ATPase [Nannocystis radixulma]MDC0675981.1 AAA family ATPase [Nannocystis radixulma]
MLWLTRLEMERFGPFAERQVLDFPNEPGVTVVYGENMRGKTSLLNAIRYAFFGTVLSRGSRERRLHTISNRESSAHGVFGFSVSLGFTFDGQEYELVRECQPKVRRPTSDDDYEKSVMLRCGRSVCGPQERERTLHQIFPKEVSRFFLFDGELLQEYEELLYSDSDTGPKISGAIERILGVPILKRAKLHLTQLGAEADKEEAREAAKQKGTEQVGIALQQATEQKEEHLREIGRLEKKLEELSRLRSEIDQYLDSNQRYSGVLEERDKVSKALDQARREEKVYQTKLQDAMSQAWRSLLRDTIKAAREAANEEAQRDFEALVLKLRAEAIDRGQCGTCEQEINPKMRARLKRTLPKDQVTPPRVSTAMTRLADLQKFNDSDNSGEIRQLWQRLKDLRLDQIAKEDHLSDLDNQLSEADPETMRRSKASRNDVLDKIGVVKAALIAETKKAEQKEQNAQRLREKLDATSTSDAGTSRVKARILRDAAAVFQAAVDQYKAELRTRVEETATKLFKSMTTEKHDYAGLSINESYGLSIMHREGTAEDGRSAGAEHVVALALMGALQKNAPLRGPIVMDSPFGRLDESHTTNVIQTLPEMAQQVILLVYEAEVERSRMRQLLGKRLLREYQLERVSARHTRVSKVSKGREVGHGAR